MAALLDVILPVFLVIGAGYVAAWRKLFSDAAADGLMIFTQRFAIPCLLFQAISRIDFSQEFDLGLLSSFYGGDVIAFLLGGLGARLLFARTPTESIAIGFGAAFSNSVLLGLPIMERAYGADALAPNFTIVALHAPILYGIGIVSMELVNSRGKGISLSVLINILRSIFSNALVIGIALGALVNGFGWTVPMTLDGAISMLARAALPAALFGLGAILVQYRPQGDIRIIAWVTVISLVVHPASAWILGTKVFDISDGQLRAAILTAAMAPGVNAYVFANMYGVEKRVAATSVLACTVISLFTAWAWLSLLP